MRKHRWQSVLLLIFSFLCSWSTLLVWWCWHRCYFIQNFMKRGILKLMEQLQGQVSEWVAAGIYCRICLGAMETWKLLDSFTQKNWVYSFLPHLLQRNSVVHVKNLHENIHIKNTCQASACKAAAKRARGTYDVPVGNQNFKQGAWTGAQNF